MSNAHTAWRLGEIAGAALQGGSRVCVRRELSCSKYSLRGRAGSQGYLPDPDFTGPEARPLRSWRKLTEERPQCPAAVRAGLRDELVGDCVLWTRPLLRDLSCRTGDSADASRKNWFWAGPPGNSWELLVLDVRLNVQGGSPEDSWGRRSAWAHLGRALLRGCSPAGS